MEMEMEMEMEHFSHKHPLKLIDKARRDDGDKEEEILCDGCRESVVLGSTAAYGCNECKFILHKKCAELPREINHPMHSEHPLTLHTHPPYGNSECICNICRIDDWKWFTYHCSVCEFDVHVSCALLVDEDVIIHQGHHHPLTFVPRSASFFCDACRTEDRDLFYRCTCNTCHFLIHKTCAKSPRTITRSDNHNHPLILTYSLPNTYRNFNHVCNICKKKVHPSYWVYYCSLCRYLAHLKCVTVEKKPLMMLRSSEEYLDSYLMNFPLPDKSVDVIGRFVKYSISLKAVNDVSIQLIHPSHDHPLILVDVQSNDAEMLINKHVQCDGCVQPISVPFYTCRECNFFLHKCCAELPEEILQHPLHPQHPLSLGSIKHFFTYGKCVWCNKFSNGLFYVCSTCKFTVDVQCACLPKAIKHDAHNHPLKLEDQYSGSGKCSGCRLELTAGSKYGCGSCGQFNLGSHCASLPRSFKHEWDPHPLTLSYPPFSYHPDESICQICKEDIDPNYWVYHCRQCDQSFHTYCIKPDDWFVKVKFGGTLEVENHPHPLVFVRKSKKNKKNNKNKKSPNSLLCSKCGKSRDGMPVVECTPCNFQLCPNCCLSIVELVS